MTTQHSLTGSLLQAENQALIELERLLDELLSGRASNDRVKEISECASTNM